MMRILLSAYACEPGKGSEPEVGLQAMLAAASAHEVWVITRENNIRSLQTFLEHHPLKERIHLVGLELSDTVKALKRKAGIASLHLYYHLWQRRLSALAVELDSEIDFHVVHHVTFAAYWTALGVSAVDKPLVWGPVGGAVHPPLSLMPVMGWRGGPSDALRLAIRPLVARLNKAKANAAKAAVVLAQNPEAEKAMGNPSQSVILPNGLVAAGSVAEVAADPAPHTGIVTASRLIGWKGISLAIRAMQYVHGEESLDIYGIGPEADRLRRSIRRLSLESRVKLHGRVSRDELLSAIARARVYLHPALHDDSPLTVVEALALGIPVVCLKEGGPPVLVDRWPNVPSRVVEPSSPTITARRLAEAVNDLRGERGIPDPLPGREFEQGLLSAYAEAANHPRLSL